jgi:hypothetical protein
MQIKQNIKEKCLVQEAEDQKNHSNLLLTETLDQYFLGQKGTKDPPIG